MATHFPDGPTCSHHFQCTVQKKQTKKNKMAAENKNASSAMSTCFYVVDFNKVVGHLSADVSFDGHRCHNFQRRLIFQTVARVSIISSSKPKQNGCQKQNGLLDHTLRSVARTMARLRHSLICRASQAFFGTDLASSRCRHFAAKSTALAFWAVVRWVPQSRAARTADASGAFLATSHCIAKRRNNKRKSMNESNLVDDVVDSPCHSSRPCRSVRPQSLRPFRPS